MNENVVMITFILVLFLLKIDMLPVVDVVNSLHLMLHYTKKFLYLTYMVLCEIEEYNQRAERRTSSITR